MVEIETPNTRFEVALATARMLSDKVKFIIAVGTRAKINENIITFFDTTIKQLENCVEAERSGLFNKENEEEFN